MYSLVMLAAMTAGPDVPRNFMCPVTPSNYGCGFWSKHCFYDCCAPGPVRGGDLLDQGVRGLPGPSPAGSAAGAAPRPGRSTTRPRAPAGRAGQAAPAAARAGVGSAGTAGASATSRRTTRRSSAARRACPARPTPTTRTAGRAATCTSRSTPGSSATRTGSATRARRDRELRLLRRGADDAQADHGRPAPVPASDIRRLAPPGGPVPMPPLPGSTPRGFAGHPAGLLPPPPPPTSETCRPSCSPRK